MDESVSDCLGGKSGFCFDWDIFLFLQVAEAMAVGDQEGGERRNARRLRVVESGFVRSLHIAVGPVIEIIFFYLFIT
jgi:hypothetical protein